MGSIPLTTFHSSVKRVKRACIPPNGAKITQELDIRGSTTPHSIASARCKRVDHAQQVGKGGEAGTYFIS